MKLLSFDIEISDVFELGKHEDLEKYAPFHISVAATAIHDGEERVWYSQDEAGRPAMNLTQQRAHELLEYLDEMQQQGFMICAWNGLSFDLKWIGHQAEDMAFAARIALKSYDPMFQFFNQAGVSPSAWERWPQGWASRKRNSWTAPMRQSNGGPESIRR
jgi:hypothetical protein